jgi:hypothetical protein
MLAVQPQLPLILPMQGRARRVRRPFHPSQDAGPYCLPKVTRDRLASALAPFRNRDAAFALATFIARFWSMPGRVVGCFPIDRRALAGHPELGLTEKRIRTAILTLEEIGFLDRGIVSGSPYKPTDDGLRRKPVLYVFGSDYAPLFIAANSRAKLARERGSRSRQSQVPVNASRPSAVNFQALSLNGPKNMNLSERVVIMGHLRKGIGIPPKAFEPDPKLETALENLKRAIGKAG